jgi:hypothetical protein
MAASKRDMENVAKHVPFVEGFGRILISAGLCVNAGVILDRR